MSVHYFPNVISKQTKKKQLLERLQPKYSLCHIHIHIIGHYNPSVRSQTNYVVRVNFVHKFRDLQFKVDTERQIFWETSHSNFNYSQFLPEIC